MLRGNGPGREGAGYRLRIGDLKKTGEGGIRTPGAGYFPHDGLANRCFKPLSHLSNTPFFPGLTLTSGGRGSQGDCDARTPPDPPWLDPAHIQIKGYTIGDAGRQRSSSRDEPRPPDGQWSLLRNVAGGKGCVPPPSPPGRESGRGQGTHVGPPKMASRRKASPLCRRARETRRSRPNPRPRQRRNRNRAGSPRRTGREGSAPALRSDRPCSR